MLLLVGGCTAGPRYRWTDATFGFRVHSDFDPQATSLLFDAGLARRTRALCALFDVDDLRGLDVFVHDHDALPHGADARVAGWHQPGEIHLLAAWNGGALGLPDPGAEANFGHELVHALHAAAGLCPPRWLEEGLCEVLSVAAVLPDGEVVLMPHAGRERELRRLRAQGRWLSADEMFAIDAGYPASAALPPLYAQATSFATWLLRDRPLSRTGLETVLARSRAGLDTDFAAWAAHAQQTDVADLFAPLADHADAGVRAATAEALGREPASAAVVAAAERLLVDPEVAVRRTARIAFVFRPDQDAATRARLAAWAAAGDRQLRMAGMCGLAQCGDAEALVGFCTALTEAADGEWAQPLLWLQLTLPDADGRLQASDPARASTDAAYLREQAATLAAAFTQRRDRLRWDGARWRGR